MARHHWILVLGVLVATPLAASIRPTPADRPSSSDGVDARYCLRVAPATGSLLETVRCWTRAQWVDQGVDVDKEWDREGVAVLR